MAIRNFTHLDDTAFPYPEGIDPYKYENDFDYSKYNKTQMRITICSVPWDVGLIHVGNAQIGGLGNVVKFESPEDRDAWLDSIENKFTWETKYREYHTDGYIEVPLPYEKAVLYNYVYVEYDLLPVDYAEGSKKRFFFFIRECQSLAPSTCKIKILRDTFQTFIYDVHVTHLMLERGHAPMAFNSADRYLSNPVENNEYLLAEDVNYGNSYKRAYATSKIFNSGDMWAVVVSSGNPQANWGSKGAGSWTTPDGTNMLDGQPTYYAVALAPENLSKFLENVDSSIPQYKSTIKGVFFIARELVKTRKAFTFAGIEVSPVSQKSQNIDFLQLTKAQFNYGPNYENLAKLYTFPYAYLEITGEDGNANIVKIEETSGNLSLFVTTSLAYPWISIDSHINGIGSGGSTIEFSNIDSHSFTFQGDWYSQLRRWSIPCFAVTQAASVAYDYSTHFDRIQQADENYTAWMNAYDNAGTIKANSDASADTSKTNADASSSTAHTNANAIALTSKTNADANANTIYQTTDRNIQRTRVIAADEMGLRTDLKDLSNALLSDENSANKAKLVADRDTDNSATIVSTSLGNDAIAATTAINATAGALSGGVGGAINGGLAGGAMGGPAGLVAGAIGGAASSIIGAATTTMTTSITISNNTNIAGLTTDSNVLKCQHALDNMDTVTGLRRTFNTDQNRENNIVVGKITRENADTQELNNTDTRDTALANAQRNYDTDLANNGRTYNTSLANNERTHNTDLLNNIRSYNTAIGIADRNRETADNAITNKIKQAALEAPKEFGSFQDGETSVTRPQGIFCNIVTQSKDAIAQAGDYFLRFGYAINRAWNFEDFNVMPKFTYWKASDMWISGNNVPDAYLDEIRFFFLGGVCVWRRPEDIGNISIYENN